MATGVEEASGMQDELQALNNQKDELAEAAVLANEASTHAQEKIAALEARLAEFEDVDLAEFM
jgi:hypothetical protein